MYIDRMFCRARMTVNNRVLGIGTARLETVDPQQAIGGAGEWFVQGYYAEVDVAL